MPKQTVAFTAPIRCEMLDYPSIVGVLVAQLMTGARIELDRAYDGRTYRIEKVRLVIGSDGTSVESLTRDLIDAQIQITAELAVAREAMTAADAETMTLFGLPVRFDETMPPTVEIRFGGPLI